MPNHTEIHQGNGKSDYEEGNADVESFANGSLFDMQEIGGDQSGAAEGGVAAGDWGNHHAEQCQDGSYLAQGGAGNFVNSPGCIVSVCGEGGVQFGRSAPEGHSDSGPDQGDQ